MIIQNTEEEEKKIIDARAEIKRTLTGSPTGIIFPMPSGQFSDYAICRNCKLYKEGICQETKTKISEDGNCSMWEQKDDEPPKLEEPYYQIIKILKKYCDLNEDYYPIVACWIIGTYIHKDFPTYPYLFFNAMKGSGKSRLLKLIASLANNGELLAGNLSEAVVFRTAAFSTLCIDEFENIGGKEKNTLRELLNAAYKKGIFVKRAIKRFGEKGERWDIEKFNVYCPITMANIWGMENVLSDRCITLILEKSNKKNITRLIEDFESDPDILALKRTFSVDSVVYLGLQRLEMTTHWNSHITTLLHDTLSSPTYTTTLTPFELDFFSKIIKTELEGRHLELFFPLFIIAKECNQLDRMIEIAGKIVNLKKEEDISESRDVALIDYIANRLYDTGDFISVREIFNNLKEDEDDWLTINWIARALKRLNLVLAKRRMARGVEVKIDFAKAKEKIKYFMPKEVEAEKIKDVIL